MMRRPPRSTLDRSSAASDVYKRQTPDSEPLLPRWAWSGAGGMMFLGAPSKLPASAMVGERTVSGPVARRSGSLAAVDASQPMAELGGLGRMAEAVADRSAAGTRPAAHLAAPLPPKLQGAGAWHEGPRGVSQVPGVFFQPALEVLPPPVPHTRGAACAPRKASRPSGGSSGCTQSRMPRSSAAGTTSSRKRR